MGALTRCLDRRCASGLLRRPPDIEAGTREVIEIIAAHAIHRYFTPGLAWTDDATARVTALDAVIAMFEPTL